MQYPIQPQGYFDPYYGWINVQQSYSYPVPYGAYAYPSPYYSPNPYFQLPSPYFRFPNESPSFAAPTRRLTFAGWGNQNNYNFGQRCSAVTPRPSPIPIAPRPGPSPHPHAVIPGLLPFSYIFRVLSQRYFCRNIPKQARDSRRDRWDSTSEGG